MRPTVPSVENPDCSACEAQPGITHARTLRTWFGSPMPIFVRAIGWRAPLE
jgi:hypothetical protein